MTAFGPFTLESGTLLRNGRPVAVGQRAMALLEALVAADGPVSKAALMEAAWPGTVVEEGNLSVQIAALRKALGTLPDGSEWIVTVPRVGYRLFRGEASTAGDGPGVPTLAVAAFDSINADADTRAFAEGLVEDIHTALGRFRGFRLLARSADSDANYRVEGSVRRSADQLRVAARLVVAAGGATAWSHTFDGDFSEGFTLQDSVSSMIAAQASRAIRQTEWNRSMRERPQSRLAYDLAQRGIALLEAIDEAGNREALELLEQAVQLEPANQGMLALASWAYEQRIHAGWPCSQTQEARCLELARAAIAAGGDDGALLAHCGMALQLCGGEWDHGLHTAMRGVEISPNNATALFFAGVAQLTGGSLEAARDLFERSLHFASDDEAGNPTGGLAHVLICEGRYGEALPLAERAVAMRPRFFWVHWAVIAANAQLGRLDAARRAMATYRAADSGATLTRIRAGQRSRDPERHANVLEGLRLAGMPDD